MPSNDAPVSSKSWVYAIVFGSVLILLILVGLIYLSQLQDKPSLSTELTPTLTPQTPMTQPTLTPTPKPTSEAGLIPDVVIDLTATNFSFSREEINVQLGQVVAINFTSQTGSHDFTLDEFDVKSDVTSPGETTTIVFVADEVGTFSFYCSIDNHRELGMEGTFMVE